MRRAVLVLNSGSSSLKASLFRRDGTRRDWHYREGFREDPGQVFEALREDIGAETPDAVGHRIVHGGEADTARLLDDAEVARLTELIPLAPLHLPDNLRGAAWARVRFGVPQVACFDTAFHQTLPELARRLPIPRAFGLRRVGFHGLSYNYIASRLPALLGEAARGRIVVAHLGSGASLCLLENLRAVDTTMGWTPAGGIPMATRSGDLDPGVMLELAARHDAPALRELVYRRMGLLALSDGESSEMAVLLASGSEAAAFAVDYFCREVRAAIGALAARSGGIDALVFTAGIGEHAPSIRTRVCDPLGLLGFVLDREANAAGATAIHAAGSKPVLRIVAGEEEIIREQVEALLDAPGDAADTGAVGEASGAGFRSRT